ncbi:TIGR04282 family arsenosugar biosynthesis glycosyltransferase [Roseivirga sp. BDSF3-8]|uniref:TIGR04282 family arsenosugar biosynthesis glycosyltransferase n=1 Tax=Roseivirga sp. BDSF3-8 TaxID=3241598 RepID=UPI0035326E08
MSNKALIVFIKNIVNNNVKTRLAATAGHPAAQKVYRILLDRTREATRETGADVTVYYTHEVLPEDEWSAEGCKQALQSPGDLGTRMKAAFTDQFDQGYEKVAIIGSDCPELDSSTIRKAYEMLDKYDVVLGPSEDGGYYLLAMKSLHEWLFQNKEWSTESVLQDTLEDLRTTGRTVGLLQTMNDIDTEEDLKSSALAWVLNAAAGKNSERT